MQQSDIPAVVNLQHAAGFYGWDADWLQQHVGAAEVVLLCARMKAEIVGFALARQLADEMELYLIVVRADLRRAGIGKKLLHELFACAQAKQITQLFLEVRAANTSAIRFYQSMGFLQISERKNYYTQPPDDALILLRAI